MNTIVSRSIALSGSANTLASLSSLLAALSPAAPAVTRFAQVIIIPVSTGNLAMTDDSTATGETGASLIPAAGIVLGPFAEGVGYIDPTKIYFISATASKAFYFIGVTQF